MHGIETAFIARVGTDTIEVKTSQRASFSACVGDGDEAQWVKVVAFGDRAQQLAGLHKGDRIYAEGRLKLKPKAPPGGEQETIQN